MNVLVVNCGSSSLKFQLINYDNREVMAKGICERIGIDGRLVYEPEGGEKEVTEAAMPDHTTAIQMVLDALVNEKTGVIKSLEEIDAIGHRVLHGGMKITNSVIIDDEVIKVIEDCADLGPLHNPANLMGINACMKLMPGVPNVAVFDTASTVPPERFAYAVNPLLPEDIVVVGAEEVPQDWHPRYQNSVKTYEYHILNREMPDPLRRRESWHVSFPLDLDSMREAAAYLRGEHDFRSFCSIHTGVKTTVRTIYTLDIDRSGNLITIRISGNGFLYNMVRIIAGTLVEVGRGFRTPENVRDILNAEEREKAGATAPPQGLVLVSIAYPERGDAEQGVNYNG